MQIRPGSMYPLGASYDGAGVNFALYSQVAQKVELCLFDEHAVDVETLIVRLAAVYARKAGATLLHVKRSEEPGWPALRLPRLRSL